MTELGRGHTSARTVRIAISATPRRADRGQSLAQALPSFIGSGAVAEWHALHDAANSAIEGSTALVVLLDARDVPTGLSALLDAAEEARLAVLLLIDDGGRRRASTETAAVESIDADDATVAAVLRGMIGRQPEVERLGREFDAKPIARAVWLDDGPSIGEFDRQSGVCAVTCSAPATQRYAALCADG